MLVTILERSPLASQRSSPHANQAASVPFALALRGSFHRP
jgi:hypothetical protein